MAELDFLTQQDDGEQASLDAVAVPAKVPATNNNVSNSENAAFTAISVGGENLVENYKLYYDSLVDGADHKPMVNAQQQVSDARNKRVLTVGAGVLTDQSIPEEVKNNVPEYLRQAQTTNPRKIVAENNLFADNGNETPKQEQARTWAMNDIDAILAYKEAAQKLGNEIAAKQDSSSWQAYKDIASSFIPGVSSFKTQTTRELALGEKEMPESVLGALTGKYQNIYEMRQHINSMPPTERLDALKKILRVVEDVNGPGIFSANGYETVEMARALVEEESALSENESIIADTAITMLNFIGLGGIAETGVKAAARLFPEVKTVATRIEPTIRFAETAATTVSKVDQKLPVMRQVGEDIMSEEQIAARETDLSAQAQNKLEAQDVQNLRQNKVQIGHQISQLEAEKTANRQNASEIAKELKTSRKNAVRIKDKEIDDQIEELNARINGINDKLAYHNRAGAAEGELSRFRQRVQASKVIENVPATPKKTPLSEAIDEVLMPRAKASFVLGEAKPSSVLSTVAEVNPHNYREMIKAIEQDTTGDLSMALTGTSRDEALVAAHMPSPGVSDIVSVRPDLILDNELVDLARAVGNSNAHYFDEELDVMRAGLESRVASVRSVRVNPQESQIVTDGANGFHIKAMVQNGDTGFTNAEEALRRTEFALSSEGVGRDSLTLHMRTPLGYKPVPKGVDVAKLPDGDYKVSVDHHWGYKMEIGQYGERDIKRNQLDYFRGLFNKMVAGGQGSLTRHWAAPTHVFHKDVTLGIIPAFDKAAGITKGFARLAKEFNGNFGKLKSVQKKAVVDYIQKANMYRIPFNKNALLGMYSPEEVTALESWKKYWDTAYILENMDAVKTLRAEGYMKYTHSASQTELFAKPMVNTQPIDGKVFDPDTGLAIELSSAGKKHIYDNNGYVAKLRNHVTDSTGEVSQYVIIKNRPGDYARAFNDNDRALNYIHGYYAVRHEAPLYVIERVRDKSGRILYERAVGEAGAIKEAEQLGMDLASNQGRSFHINGADESDFYVRQDIKNTDAIHKSSLDIGISSGRSAQRTRGNPLESYDPLASGQSQYVQNPVDSMKRTAYSLGNRIATRDVIETMKKRFIQQYDEFLPSSEKTFTKVFPDDPAVIGANAVESKKLRDARTTYEYINQLESGYVSGVDALFREGIRMLADGLGAIPFNVFGKGGAETFLREYAGHGKISSDIKAAVFNTMLVAKGAGTFLLQASQSTSNLMFANPATIIRDLASIQSFASGLGTKEMKARGAQLWKEWQRTGHQAAVDIHGASYQGGASVDTTALSGLSGSPVLKGPKAIMHFMQGTFFNKGELVNQFTAWLAKRADFEGIHGRPPSTQRELDLVHAEARRLTYTMNKAGQMAYNENTLSLPTQFFQVLHKAILDPVLTRGMSLRDRSRLVLAPFLMYGIPQETLNYVQGVVESTDLDREAKDVINKALEWSGISQILASFSEELGDKDYGRYNPVDPVGTVHRITELTSFPEFFTRNPASTLATKGMSTLATTMRYLGIAEPEDGIVPTDLAMLKSIGNLLSGTSNFMRGSILVENGVFVDKYGKEIPGEYDEMDAYLQQYLGVTPRAVAQHYNFQNYLYKHREEAINDAKVFIKNAKEQLFLNGLHSKDPQYVQTLMNACTKKFKEHPGLMDIYKQELRADFRTYGESSFIMQVFKAAGYLSEGEVRKLSRMSADKEQMAELNKLLDFYYKTGE